MGTLRQHHDPVAEGETTDVERLSAQLAVAHAGLLRALDFRGVTGEALAIKNDVREALRRSGYEGVFGTSPPAPSNRLEMPFRWRAIVAVEGRALLTWAATEGEERRTLSYALSPGALHWDAEPVPVLGPRAEDGPVGVVREFWRDDDGYVRASGASLIDLDGKAAIIGYRIEDDAVDRDTLAVTTRRARVQHIVVGTDTVAALPEARFESVETGDDDAPRAA